MALNINDLTLGEMALVEDMSGLPLSALADDAQPKTRLLIALVVMIRRRETPTYAVADAEKLTMSELQSVLALGEEPDPKGLTA